MFTKGPWEVKTATFTEKGVAFEVIMPEQVICAGDAHLIEKSPRMFEWISKVAKQDFVVFPEDKVTARGIVKMLDLKEEKC